MKKLFAILFLLLVLVAPLKISARENVTDWYIKDFHSEIKVYPNSTLIVTEDIVADCGDAIGKHGIFRILPLYYKTDKSTTKTPVTLFSITDFEGKALSYTETVKDDTITWKIGDPDIEVLGVNNYRIMYSVGNVVGLSDQNDLLFWNLTGNFWDLEIDNFGGSILFPENINQGNCIRDRVGRPLIITRIIPGKIIN